MSTTLQYALETLEALRRFHSPERKRRRVGAALAGKYKGLLPEGMTSASLLRKLRDDLYGNFPLP